jgi:hypothetical protein
MTFLPQSSRHVKRMKAEAKLKRAGLLSVLPNDFTTKIAREIWKLDSQEVSGQITMMLKYKEIDIVKIENPRSYRKVNH